MMLNVHKEVLGSTVWAMSLNVHKSTAAHGVSPVENFAALKTKYLP